ncbi:DUF2269 domain-containing protein [Micromonospora sp. CPCC 206061]|uniref:DUF2269 domain-containing protein n=1 Tax=Micromonospora sp. CPCC 206061 TaxID=3122410 RepID=UPI002FF2334E
MIMPPPVRRLALTVHVTTSVGWLGAVSVFVVLGVVGMVSQDTDVVRAAYLIMEPTAWYALVPLAFASLASGLVQSLGTTWGLVRHYWVIFKLVINIGAVVVLLMYTQTLAGLADAATTPAFTPEALGPQRASPTIHAVVALLLLVLATILAIYKPRGTTRFARRRQRSTPADRPEPVRS